MFFLYSGGSGSPIQARQNAPIFLILSILALFCCVVILIAFILKKYSDYKKSPEYIDKEQNRITTKPDVLKFSRLYNLNKNESAILWEVCRITQWKNIFYELKNNNNVNDLFRKAFEIMKAKNELSDEKLQIFFTTLFKLELVVAQTKKIYSTKQLPANSIIFYISEEGEQYPFTVLKNTNDFFIVEFPEFLEKTNRMPEKLIKTRFTYKTSNGLSYNFISRIIRYELQNDGKNTLIIAHTDQMVCQTQRHFKREFFQEQCFFSPIHVNLNEKNPDKKYVFSEKQYEGKLSNISAGGCCIQTKLPVKEKQYLTVKIPNFGIDDKIIGIIKTTRKLPSGIFALHIQFIDLSLHTKNKIYTLVYKYEL